MPTDLVERLRAGPYRIDQWNIDLMREAADLIESQRNAVIEQCARVCDTLKVNNINAPFREFCAEALRSLKSTKKEPT